MTHAVEEWDRAAEFYDLIAGEPDPGYVPFLRSLTTGEAFLELGCGTGRVSIPLAASGAFVCGVDSSVQMISAIDERNKTAERKVTARLGDMVSPPFEGQSFDCIYATDSSFYCLLEQRLQLECLRNNALLLNDDGVLLIDGFFPKAKDVYEATTAPRMIGDGQVIITSAHGNPETQLVRLSDTIVFNARQPAVVNCTVRFVWPSELDLMAELAGLSLVARYGWVDKRDFNGSSYYCLSVFARSQARRSVRND